MTGRPGLCQRKHGQNGQCSARKLQSDAVGELEGQTETEGGGDERDKRDRWRRVILTEEKNKKFFST